MSKKILIVDDETTIRESLSSVLAEEGYSPVTAADGDEASTLFDRIAFDAVICDIRMPGINGIDLLRRIKTSRPGTPVVMMTAYASVDTAVEALRQGAVDYIIKPFLLDDVVFRIKKLFQLTDLTEDNRLLREEVAGRYDFSDIIGQSQPVREMLELIKRVASSKGTVLITGESGTGKELVARAIHNRSDRRAKRFIPVNCCAIPATLLDSMLFGYRKGAFTDAQEDRKGLFEVANEGTLFLDEIGDLSVGLQTKLLRAIEEKEILPVGGTERVKVDIRLIAATHQDLQERMNAGTFREDLYYRLNIVEIKVPPLRERIDDLPLLVNHFIRKYNLEMNRRFRDVSPEVLRVLSGYRWKGNIRELENVMERSMILGTPPTLQPEDLPPNLLEGDRRSETLSRENLKSALRVYERMHIEGVLERSGCDKQKAAERLGISLATLYRKLEQKE
ncbi:MAG: sigma-54-dependent Fis family transcriptional regulator [Deltaproteobacteria bacterium]|nr:sigma-54-dependent Fis family transcriptional regulator [Deltaproteobacteria bacterium]